MVLTERSLLRTPPVSEGSVIPTGTAEVLRSTGYVRDPLAAIAVSAAPIVLEGRYRLLVGALVRLRRSRRGRWALAAGWGAFAVIVAFLAARHFATTSWPLSADSRACSWR